MSAKLTKSKERVKKFGEVFTPEHIVNDMLDMLPEDAFEIEKTFLEPACGTGNFLVEIERRKLTKCKSEEEGLIALRGIYGVDILADNVAESRERMYGIWKEFFGDNPEVMKILERNIVQNDFLKMDASTYWESDNDVS